MPTQPLTHAQGDVELLVRVRGGDAHADAQLLDRHRAAVAELGPSEAFDSVDASGRMTLALVRNGTGKDLPFRAAWLAVHANGRLPAAAGRGNVVWRAFCELPAAWRIAVWHREVEGQRTQDIAALLDMDEVRASRALASAYAAMKRHVALAHGGRPASPECEDILGRYRFSPPSVMVAGELRALREHGRHCDGCLGMIRQLFLVEHTLRDTLARVVLGAAAEDYLARRPRVARLRLPGPAGEAVSDLIRPRRVVATVTAAGLGAAAMALAFAGPQLSPVRDRAPLASEPPALGTYLARDLPPTAAGLGVDSPRTALVSPVALETVTSSTSGAGSGGQQDGGHGGPGSSGGPGVPATPSSPQAPTPVSPTPVPSPGTPPAADDDLVNVGVSVSQSSATVEVAGPDDDPVVVEVPIPETPAAGSSLPEVPEVTGGLP